MSDTYVGNHILTKPRQRKNLVRKIYKHHTKIRHFKNLLAHKTSSLPSKDVIIYQKNLKLSQNILQKTTEEFHTKFPRESLKDLLQELDEHLKQLQSLNIPPNLIVKASQKQKTFHDKFSANFSDVQGMFVTITFATDENDKTLFNYAGGSIAHKKCQTLKHNPLKCPCPKVQIKRVSFTDSQDIR